MLVAVQVSEAIFTSPRDCFRKNAPRNDILFLLPLLHRQHKVIRVFGKQFNRAIGTYPVGIFDAETHALLRIIQSGLDGDDHTRLEDIVITRC